MEENSKKFQINYEKIAAYIAIVGLLFMFWSFWRDLHLQQADTRERIAKLEVEIQHLKEKYG